ncbi:MFS transporter [Rhizobium beringeri]|uniref:MFS transporter n=1 Tax=Rhizobium beringeri TaxID=3019934 RepID=A0ABY1XGX9_9HYPH|nr:MFS transporter [Rhizobium beringeri]TBE57801.1 MFS transporter [Rhizobium beringeri]
MPPNKQKIAYALFTVLSFGLVGVGIVLPSWIAFQVGGSKLVGLILLASSLAGVLLAPAAGHLVDKHDRKAMSAIGQATRAIAMLLVGFAEGSSALWGAILLIVSSIAGAFGFAVLSGSLGGLLQRIIPAEERAGFALRMSVAKQIGIACGTGAAGIALYYLGSSAAAYLFGAISFICIGLLRVLPTSQYHSHGTATGGFLASNLEALRYFLRRPECLAAVLFTGLSYSIVQVTNLLLPGFVTNSLHGDSSLFGMLEMVAALAGAASALLVSGKRIAELLRRRMIPILVMSGLSLVAFSFSQISLIAVITYCASGMLWSVCRALASANFLIVVDNEMIGRAQGFSTLLTSAFGGIIYLVPIMLPAVGEADLYLGYGLAIILCVVLVSFLARPRSIPIRE